MEFIRALMHPTEIGASLIYKIRRKFSTRFSADVKIGASPELKKCYWYMGNMNEGYSFAIRSLYGEFRDAACIFYLILQAFDAIEDDVSISKEEKLRLLPEFHRFLQDPTWTYYRGQDRSGILLEDFTTISSQYRLLDPMFQRPISDACAEMGPGMAIYLNKSIDSIEDWEEYCHFVCGRVFVALAWMISELGMEHTKMADDKNLCNSIGVFIQKLDIIKDLQEDLAQGRQFWPRQIWTKYCKDLRELTHPSKAEEALSCLNEMVTNTLKHIPDILKYLDRIQNLPIFEFFAVFQVLAIATLERCYNNRQVFSGNSSIRKGEAANLMMKAANITDVKAIFYRYLRKIEQRIPVTDPSAKATRSAVEEALSLCSVSKAQSVDKMIMLFFMLMVSLFAFAMNYF